MGSNDDGDDDVDDDDAADDADDADDADFVLRHELFVLFALLLLASVPDARSF